MSGTPSRRSTQSKQSPPRDPPPEKSRQVRVWGHSTSEGLVSRAQGERPLSTEPAGDSCTVSPTRAARSVRSRTWSTSWRKAASSIGYLHALIEVRASARHGAPRFIVALRCKEGPLLGAGPLEGLLPEHLAIGSLARGELAAGERDVVDQVVEHGGALAWVRSHQSTDPLDGAPLGAGGRGEHETLEPGDVEPLIGQRSGA